MPFATCKIAGQIVSTGPTNVCLTQTPGGAPSPMGYLCTAMVAQIIALCLHVKIMGGAPTTVGENAPSTTGAPPPAIKGTIDMMTMGAACAMLGSTILRFGNKPAVREVDRYKMNNNNGCTGQGTCPSQTLVSVNA